MKKLRGLVATRLVISGLIGIGVAGGTVFVLAADQMPERGPIPFAQYDKDGNGYISESEFTELRQERQAQRAEQGKPMRGAVGAPSFAAFDTDGDGQLTQEELTAGQRGQMQKRRDQKGKGMGPGAGRGTGPGTGGKGRNMPAFSDYDLNGDGDIVESEFAEARGARMKARVEQGYPLRNAANMPDFADIDKDGNGKIDAQEFTEHQQVHRKAMREQWQKNNQ